MSDLFIWAMGVTFWGGVVVFAWLMLWRLKRGGE